MRALGLTAVLALVLLATPAHAGEPESLEAATTRAAALSQALERSASRDGGYRVALERLEAQRLLAQARLDARVRAVWTARRPEPLGGLPSRLAAAGLRRITDRGAAAGGRVDRGLVEQVGARSAEATALRAEVARARGRLSAEITDALAAQESARRLLARAEDVAQATEALLFTGHLSASNLRLYARAGYVEQRRSPVDERVTLVHLRKSLS